jgi:hypothetical protein
MDALNSRPVETHIIIKERRGLGRKLSSLAGLLLFLIFGSVASAPNGFSIQNQGQPEQARFYAVRVVFEQGVLNAKDALGAPDGRYAEILPGGQLVLLMEKELYVFLVGIDWESGGALDYSGAVVAKGETAVVLEGWLPIAEAQGGGHRWIPIGTGSTLYILPGSIMRVNLVRITNTGTTPLFVDAVIGVEPEKERK